MGNSNGTLAEYWDAIESTPGLQGGFIWEFWDHGLVQPLPDGRRRWAYGGDFGDDPHDGNFVADGLVWPDRRPEAGDVGAQGARGAGPDRRPAADLALGRVEIANRQHFVDLGWLARSCAPDGRRRRARGGAVRPARPRTRRATVVDLPGGRPPEPARRGVPDGPRHDGGRVAPWAPSGFEVCAPAAPDRARDCAARPWRPRLPATGRSRVDDDGRLHASALCRAADALALARADRQRPIGGMAAAGPRPASTGSSGAWSRSSEMGATTIVRSEYTTATGSVVPHEQTFRRSPMAGSGSTRSSSSRETSTDLPRVGTVLEMRPGSSSSRWFGTGPARDVSRPQARRARRPLAVDRHASSYVPYIRPQENGGHADVRWLELTDATGAGVRIDLDVPAPGVGDPSSGRRPRRRRPTTPTLEPRAETIVHLDAAHRGLGTASCGPDTLPEYLVGPGTHRWSWTLRDLAAPDRADRAGRPRPRVPPAQRPHQLRLRVHENGSLGHLHFGPPLATGSLVRVTSGPARSTASRTGSATRSPLEYPTPGTGDFRVPAPHDRARRRLDGPGPRLRRPPDRARQAADLPPAFRRPTSRPTTRRTPSRSSSRDELAGIRSRAPRTRSSATSPIVARSATDPQRRRERRSASRRAMSAALDLPDADWELVAAQRHLGAREPRRRARASARPAVRRRATAAHRAISTTRSSRCAARRPPRRRARRYGFSLVYSGNFLAEAEVDPFDTTRVRLGISPDTFTWRSSRARRS